VVTGCRWTASEVLLPVVVSMQVGYGVDADRNAAASFMLNTADGVEGPFNPPGFGPTDTRHSTVRLLGVGMWCLSNRELSTCVHARMCAVLPAFISKLTDI
jgi:hypothetical protein